MPSMLDLIRNSQVPSNLMQSAARGALAVSPEEMIAILVHLALHNKLFSEQARLTLAGWDEKTTLVVAANPKTSAEVLEYLVSPENLRPVLLPALAENPSVSEAALDALAASKSRSVVEVLWTSRRVMNSPRLLRTLQSNPNLRENEATEIKAKLDTMKSVAETADGEADGHDEEVEGAVAKYLQENAAELAATPDKPFQPIGMALEGPSSDAVTGAGQTADTPAATAASSRVPGALATAAGTKAAATAAPARKQPQIAHDERRDSMLQKIAKLDVKGRIALAMRGDKEARSILIRDGTKLVALAVLESPKISDGEVENFAQQKNVMDSVLRAIPLKRRFAKNYIIIRNLAFNPRSPIDLSLGLVKHLLVHDLKNLVGNKEVSETVRKSAMRLYRQKMEVNSGKGGGG
jgi:hypothetical protein